MDILDTPELAADLTPILTVYCPVDYRQGAKIVSPNANHPDKYVPSVQNYKYRIGYDFSSSIL